MGSVSDLLESRQYMAALALNNLGVSLLESHQYRDAVQTMKKAFDHVKVRFPCLSDNSGVSQAEADLNRAFQLIAKAQMTDRCNEDKRSGTFVQLHALPDNSLYQAAHSYPMSETCYAIKIDTTCDYFNSYFLLNSSIIILNYAAAYRCYAIEKTTDPEKSHRLLESAYRLLKTALGVLFSAPARSLSEDDELAFERIELVSMLVMQGLMQLAFELGHQEEGRKYYIQLGDLHVNQNRRAVSHSGIRLQNVAPAA